MTEELPLVLSVPELARVLRIGRNQAYALVASGAVRSVRVGVSIRVPRRAVEEFLEGEDDHQAGLAVVGGGAQGGASTRRRSPR